MKYLIIMLVILISNISIAIEIDIDIIEVAYTFDDDENTIIDISGNKKDGTLIGGKYVDGVFGMALEYNGVDDNIVIENYTGIGGTDARSVLLWFKSNDLRKHSLVKWGVNRKAERYAIRTHVVGEECYLRVEVHSGNHFGADNICDNNWHHLAVVLPEGSDAVEDHNLYVDGVLQTKDGLDHVLMTNNEEQEVNIGANLFSGDNLSGAIDDVVIFNTALDEKDINTVRKRGIVTALSVNPHNLLTYTWARIKTNR